MSRQPITTEWMQRMEGKETFVQRLFTVFVTEEPKRVELIRSALEQKDSEQIAYLTHSLKGSAATMGAEELRESCLRLELAAKDGDVDLSAQCFQRLEEEMSRVFGFMQNYLNQSAA